MTDVVDTKSSVPLHKNPWVWGFIIGAVALTAMRPLQEAMIKAPPAIASPGDWTLTSDANVPFGSDQLRGKVFVASFMFTRCRSICLDLVKAMATVESSTSRHGDALQLVSFSVDPTYDTPAVLRAYRKKYGVTSPRWTFVTGELAEVHDLIAKRLPFHVGDVEKKQAPIDEGAPADALVRDELVEIAHYGKLALFDQRGDLRAVFSTDAEGLTALGSAAGLLIRKGPTP